MITTAGHGYVSYTRGCRCDVCRAAKAAYMSTRRAQGRSVSQDFAARYPTARLSTLPDGVSHGTRSAYDERGCRCPECSAARADSDARYARRN